MMTDDRLKRRRYQKAGWIVVSLILLAGVGYYMSAVSQKAPVSPLPAPVVSVMRVEPTAVYPQQSFVAKIESQDKVGLRARVQGFLQKRLFKEGDLVTENQPLFIIEPVNFEANVREAEALVSKAESQVKNAKSQYERTTKLYRTKDVSLARLDETEADFMAAQASLAQAKARQDIAQKDLEYTTIVSPMDGKIGESVYSVGELIGPSSGVLAEVVRINPIDAVFSVSENQLLHLQKEFFDSRDVDVRFVKADGSVYPYQGRIVFVDVALDEGMNTLKIKATFPNPKGKLISGQYGRIIIKSLEPKEEIVVPQQAVQQDMTGTYVYIVSNDHLVERREVRRGLDLPDFEVVISKGLSAGETIVIAGFQKIVPQMRVEPQFQPREQSSSQPLSPSPAQEADKQAVSHKGEAE